MNASVSTGYSSVRLLTVVALLLLLLGNKGYAEDNVKVDISGLSGEPLANVQASLSVLRQQGDPMDEAVIHSLHEKAEWEIRRALEPFGYYRPVITAALEQSSDPASPWRASYHVEAGEQIPIGRVDLTFSGPGQNSEALQALSDAFPLRDAATLDHRRYEAGKRELLQQTRELGYLDAKFVEQQVEVDLAAYSAAITLAMDTGHRYLFGAITFEQDQFAHSYLEDYLIIEEGQPYSESELSRQRAALSKSGHFREVGIVTGQATTGAQPKIPLHIQLNTFKPNRYRGRVGWGTDTDFGVQLDWTRRYVGRRGHHFTLGGAAVQERERLAANASYTIPLDPLSGNNLELLARHESKDLTYEDVDLTEGGDTRIATNIASVFWHRPHRRLGDHELRSSLGLGLVGETYDVFEVLFGNLPDSVQDVIINGNENVEGIGREAYKTLTPDFEALVPTLRLQLRRADNPLYIRRGDYYDLEVLGANESLGSNFSFWQARLSTWNIWPLGDNNRLLLRSSWGYSDADSSAVFGINFNQMPEYFEFRAGGARSVRGYGFEELFSADTITGGKHLAVASIEYEHEFIPDFSAAVFVDGGNAFNDWDNIDEKLGAGFGLRWRSPVGLARIDFGFPLDDADDSFQIYITVGPEF